MLAADLDSEVQACVMGARRMEGLFARFGRDTVEACFQAILDKCRDIYRNELLPEDRRRRIFLGTTMSSTTASPIPSCTNSRSR